MKDYMGVKQKIQILSATVGWPVCYASDLNVCYEVLEEYKGQRFLLILRMAGVQLALLDNQTDDYRCRKLEEFKFYYSQCRDAQFYYFNGRNLAAIDPLTALNKLAAKKTDFGKLQLRSGFSLRRTAENITLEV